MLAIFFRRGDLQETWKKDVSAKSKTNTSVNSVNVAPCLIVIFPPP